MGHYKEDGIGVKGFTSDRGSKKLSNTLGWLGCCFNPNSGIESSSHTVQSMIDPLVYLVTDLEEDFMIGPWSPYTIIRRSRTF